jgi:hypothetical protein
MRRFMLAVALGLTTLSSALADVRILQLKLPLPFDCFFVL